MLSPAIRLEPNVPDFQFCLAMCAGRKIFICECNQNTGHLFWCNLVLLFCYDLFDCTTKNTHNFYKYWDISAVYALCRNPGRHLCHMESPWSHLHVCYEQGCTTCCSLAAGLRENGERMRKWRRNGERTRLCVTHQMSRKKRNYSVDWTVPYEMMNYKWYLMVLGQYMTILAGTWSV